MKISDCNILVVDDTDVYLDQIVETLSETFEISVATSGQMALEQVRENPPDFTAHDLKGPLTGIISFPSLILKKAELSDKHKDFLEKTIQLGKKMLNMINMSLDLYKMEQGTYEVQFSPIDIVPVIQDIIAENARTIQKRNLIVIIQVNESDLKINDSFEIAGEELLFYSALSNLIKNAIEASIIEDKIFIKLFQKNRKKIEIRNAQSVPESIKNCFFDKFVTAGKTGGTGLGTYSARLITETLGGTIHMKSSEKTGTAITMQFDN